MGENSEMSNDDLPTGSVPDDQLDRLLRAAEWPEVEAEVIARLENTWKGAVAEAAPVRHGPRQTVKLAPVIAAGENAEHGRLRWIHMAGLAALVTVAFLAGRWTRSDSNENTSVVENDVPVTDNDRVASNDQNTAAAADVPPVPDGQPVADGEVPMVADVGTVESDQLKPVPEDSRMRRRTLSKTVLLQQKVDSVLACIERTPGANVTCVEPLMKWRRESEFLLWQIVQNTTGQRRLAAITAIGFVGSDRSVPGLVSGLKTKDLRDASLNAILQCADENSLAVFVRQRQDRGLAEEFVRALIKRPAARSQSVYLKLMTAAESRDICLTVVDELSSEAMNLTFAALDSNVISERIAAAITLGARKDDATLNRIVGLIRQYPTRWEPVAALMWNGSQQGIRFLNQMQRNPESFAVLQTASVQLKSFIGGRGAD
jgi:hypothetical protein